MGPVADEPDAVRAAILTLAALPDGELDPHALAPRLVQADAALRREVERLFDERDDYAGPLAAFLRRRLGSDPDPRTVELVARFAGRPEVAALVPDAAVAAPDPAAFWNDVADAEPDGLPDDWHAAVAAAVRAPAARAGAFRLLAEAGVPDAGPVPTALRGLADDLSAGPTDRLAAAAVLPSVTVGAGRLAELREVLSDPAAGGKADAVRILAAADFTPDARAELPAVLSEAGPLTLPALLPVVRGGDPNFAAAALGAVRENPAFAAVPENDLRAAFGGSGSGVAAAVDAALAEREAERAGRRATLAAAFDALPPGDAGRGADIFRSEKAACMTCHRIGQQGGDFGPSLFGIGKVRTERDLHEAIVLPGASFVRSYEPWVALTAEGRAHGGLLKDETDRTVTLAEKPDARVTLDRADLLELAPGSTSLMPAGLDRQITDQQMADLLAFLAANRGWE